MLVIDKVRKWQLLFHTTGIALQGKEEPRFIHNGVLSALSTACGVKHVKARARLKIDA